MLMCNKSCVYSENGYCLLSAEEHLSGTLSGCDNFKEKRKNFAKSKNKVNGFANGTDINKLNGIGDIGTH